MSKQAMEMAELNIKLKVKTAWWLYPYLNTLALFCAIFGTVPDMAKVDRMIHRAIRVTVETRVRRHNSR